MGKARQDLAYELYNSLGEKRSYEKVAELMGLSVKTVGLWGSKGKWQEKIEQEYQAKTNEIRQKREELELLGFDVALSALGKIKDKINDGKLNKELGQIYELFLSCPFNLNNSPSGVEDKSAGDVNNNTDNKIEICFDINGGVSSED